jgi:hypothetical protein
VFRRFWDEGAKDEIPRAQAWLQQTGPAIIAQLTAATPAGTREPGFSQCIPRSSREARSCRAGYRAREN